MRRMNSTSAPKIDPQPTMATSTDVSSWFM